MEIKQYSQTTNGSRKKLQVKLENILQEMKMKTKHSYGRSKLTGGSKHNAKREISSCKHI